MRNDVRLRARTVSASGALCDRFLESVFFTGNGRMGLRGCALFRPRPRPLDAGLFVAGIFDRLSGHTELTDFVALPSPRLEITLGGEKARLCSEVRRRLDLDTGELRLDYAVAAAGRAARVTERRVFPMDEPERLYMRAELEGDGELRFSLDRDISNSTIPDDQVKENSEVVQMFRPLGADGARERFSTRWTGLEIGYALSQRREGRALDAVCEVRTSRDADPRIGSLEPAAGYGAALERAREQLARRWENCAVRIEGDEESESALSWVIYELLANLPARDGTVSVGARGLTHTRYKGCCFWDTEMFVLPFALLTDPEAARKLLDFRVRTLPAARAHAKKMNAAGARYPWMVALDGSEQCESWDIGCSEVHVTADIAYAAGQYMDWTQDGDFLLRGGAEMLCETARFWPSRVTPAPDGVNLLFCKGPDEYCGITSNNLYTNCMIRRHLELAGRAAAALAGRDAQQYARLGLSDRELGEWRELAGKLKLPRDPQTGRYRQDDTFHLLEPADMAALKPDDTAAYSRVCFDALQRLRVIKQADVLLLMTRLPGLFSREEKLAAWEDFEPLCLHDSTLSFATHALFAAQNGLERAAVRYFDKALWLDLRDVMGNTGKEGLHLACLGETWQAAVFGFAGLRLENGRPALSPHLPAAWRGMEFKFFCRGRKFSARITKNSSEIKEIKEA